MIQRGREFTIALEVLLDFRVKYLWHVCPLGEFKQGIQFLAQELSPDIDTRNNLGQVTYRKRIKSNSEYHPEDRYDFLSNSHRIDVSEAHSSQGLQSPVDGSQVLGASIFVNIILSNHPSIWPEIIKLGKKKPHTANQVNKEEYRDSDGHHLDYADIHVDEIEHFLQCFIRFQQPQKLKESENPK